MNKNRMILAASGGVIGLAVLAMAYFTWSAYSAKIAALEGDDEGTDGLEAVQSKAQTLSRKSIYPCAASVKAIEANTEHLATWQKEAVRLASRGDRPIRKMTPPQFKADLATDAKRLAALPGGVNGLLMKPDFAFGPFRSYIAEGKMPTEAEMPELQRRWDDVVLIVETLGASGVSELVNVDFKALATDDEKEKKEAKKTKKPPVKRRAGTADKPTVAQPSAFAYAFTFATRAPAFVKAVNALATNDRFIVIDDLSITRTGDPIGEALGAEKREASRSAGRGGRRGRRGAAVEEKQEDEAESKNGIVTDPVLDAPFTVTLAVTVYDFKTMEEENKAEEGVK